MKKIILILSVSIFSLLLAALLIYGSGMLFAYLKPGEPLFPREVTIAREHTGSVSIGELIPFTFDAVIPADAKIISARLTLPEKCVASGELKSGILKWQWNKDVLRFNGAMRPVKTGEIAQGSVDITVSNSKSGEKSFKVSIPEFICEAVPQSRLGSRELQLAGPAVPISPAEKSRTLLIIGIAALLLIAAAIIILWLLLRKKRTADYTAEPWELAIGALEKLRRDLKVGDLLPQTAFGTLSDIVRNYLESRFMLPASRRTTVEFLADLADSNSALPEEHKPFLAGFMQAADMVKFARSSADTAEVENAVNHAEKLVRETTPNDETEDKKQHR